jgi:hypothetical protein
MSDTVLSLDRSGADAMNMAVLNRLDSDIVRIVDTVSHVKMYERDGKEWVSLWGIIIAVVSVEYLLRYIFSFNYCGTALFGLCGCAFVSISHTGGTMS